MTKVTTQDIKKTSRLARIAVPQDQLETLANQVGSIINWVDKLNEIETENVEPLVSVHENSLFLNKDEITDGGNADDVLKNAPDAKYGYFTVPKVIE